MSHYVMLYSTFPDVASAEGTAKELLEARLVACCNILSQAQSLYWWEGKIESSNEVVLIAKTHADNKTELLSALEQHHPYDTPCAVFYPIEGGSEPYLRWLQESLGSDQKSA